jgi:hypothetical protein
MCVGVIVQIEIAELIKILNPRNIPLRLDR